MAGERLDPFDRVLQRHGTRAYRAALRILGDGDAAADATNEALLALRDEPAVARSPRALAWLLRVVRNRALDRLRLNRRRPWQALREQDLGSDREEPSAVAELREQRRRLWSGLASLPERQRQVVMLRSLDGMRFPAIAEQLGISVGATKVHYRRAMTVLAQLLNDVTDQETSP